MRWYNRTCLAMMGAALLGGCDFDSDGGGGSNPPPPTATPTPSPASYVVTVDFASDASWTAGFADFSPGMEPLVDFKSGLAPVPPALEGVHGFLLGGNNPADDVALYVWRKIEHLEPNTRYRIDADVSLATNAPAECAGIGGQPGESVTFKVGAGRAEPALVLVDGVERLNLDKGDQTQGGADVAAIGNLASPFAGTCEAPRYAGKLLSSGGSGPVVRSDANGSLWLIMLTDSGFEGRTELYLLAAKITLTVAP